ncbi:UNVERIFIED_CONTAM: hypothetical protein DQE83_28290, partial [Escherichia coli]
VDVSSAAFFAFAMIRIFLASWLKTSGIACENAGVQAAVPTAGRHLLSGSQSRMVSCGLSAFLALRPKGMDNICRRKTEDCAGRN